LETALASTQPRSWRDIPQRHINVLAYLLLVLITLPLLTKIFTSDFGTHIAIGREIVQTRSIPDREFLNHPSLGMHNPNGEWGFQALLYLVFAAGDAYAVSFLCWAVVLGIFFFLFRSTVLRGAHPLLAVLAIFAFSGFLRIRIQPRPEIFTYLFIALTIYLHTEYYYGGRKRLLYLFPALILVWANMHPSYLMAFLLCGAFFADALARSAWKRELRWERLREWALPPIAVGAAGLLLCGLNPYGYKAILIPLHLISRGGGESSILLSISELTPVRQTGMLVYYKAAAAFAAASLLLGAVGRRVYLLDLFLFALAFKGAWDSSRAVSMMGLFIAPGAALHLTGFLGMLGERFGTKAPAKAREAAAKGKKAAGKGRRPAPDRGPKTEETESRRAQGQGSRPSRVRIVIAGILVAALLAFGGTTLSFSFSQIQYGVGLTKHKFSLSAGEFLRENPIPGNMFNFFDIGGFLGWQLHPQTLTFIDGRTYNQQVFLEHQTVTGAAQGWEAVLRKYDVSHIVTKTIDSSGMVLPLIPELTGDPGWELVFADGLFVVFVRNSPENRDYIARFRIPKSRIPQQIVWESYHYMYLGVSPVVAYQNMSSMYDAMGDRPAAIAALRKALEHGDFPFLRARLLQLEGETSPRGPAPHPGGAR
jgi:hypothetical protein